jgi:hypothetical protein
MSRLVACVPDLMDRSKVAAVAPDATFCRAPGDLLVTALNEGATLAVIDLSRAGALEAAAELRQAGVATVAFGSHVDDALLDAAREAGCEEVLPRSIFFRRLGDLLGPA